MYIFDIVSYQGIYLFCQIAEQGISAEYMRPSFPVGEKQNKSFCGHFELMMVYDSQ